MNLSNPLLQTLKTAKSFCINGGKNGLLPFQTICQGEHFFQLFLGFHGNVHGHERSICRILWIILTPLLSLFWAAAAGSFAIL